MWTYVLLFSYLLFYLLFTKEERKLSNLHSPIFSPSKFETTWLFTWTLESVNHITYKQRISVFRVQTTMTDVLRGKSLLNP